MSLLEGELAGIIGDALIGAGIPYPIKLIRPGQTTPGANPWDPPVTTPPQVFNCMGFVDGYSDFLIAQGVVEAQDRKINIVATTLPTEPETTDIIEAQGRTFTIISVKTDPAGALWEVQAR